MSRAGRTERPRDGGYTYVSLLVILVAATLAAQTTWMPSATKAQREMEAELIFRGLAYREAIRSFHDFDAEAPAWPATLDQLLADPRDPEVRHIRRLYEPPGGGEWTTVDEAGGGIMGVMAEIDGTPFRRDGFPEGMAVEEDAEGYDDWQFVFVPEDAAAPE